MVMASILVSKRRLERARDTGNWETESIIIHRSILIQSSRLRKTASSLAEKRKRDGSTRSIFFSYFFFLFLFFF